jgi:integrase/recombinase XerD
MLHLPETLPMNEVWQRCLNAFLRRMLDRSGSTSTHDRYTRVLERFFADGRNPDQYTHAEVEAFVTQVSASTRNQGQPVSIATKNQRLAILSSFYKFAASYSVDVDGDPAYLLQRPAPTTGFTYGKPERHYRAFSYNEMEKFFEVIPSDTVQGLRDRAVFLLYFWSARRRSEIARLTWGDLEQTIFLEDGTQRVGWLYRFYGKGRSTQQDSAEMPEPAMLALLHYLDQSGRLTAMMPDSPLFLSLPPRHGGNYRNVGKALSGHAMNEQLKYYARLAGLDASRLSIHSWRHTAALQRHVAGQDILEIMRLLRHSSLRMTQEYLHILSGEANSGAKLLRERFGKFSE